MSADDRLLVAGATSNGSRRLCNSLEVQPPVDKASRNWPDPSIYTLLAWVEVELLLESGAQVDAAHAVVTDGAARAFGPGWVDALTAAALNEGVPASKDGFPSLLALRADEDKAERVLRRLHTWMRSRLDEPGSPPAPRDDFLWSADEPDFSG